MPSTFFGERSLPEVNSRLRVLRRGRCGPNERFGVLIVVSNEAIDVRAKFGNQSEGYALKGFPYQDRDRAASVMIFANIPP